MREPIKISWGQIGRATDVTAIVNHGVRHVYRVSIGRSSARD